VGRRAGLDPTETRRRLLDAAAAEFDLRGLEGARVSDIASRAGLSNGALYRHFGSKAELLAAALADRGSRQIEVLFPGVEVTSIAPMLAYVGRNLDRARPAQGGLMIEALVAAKRDPEVAAVVREHLAEGEQWLGRLLRGAQEAGVMEAGVDTDALAHLCLLIGLGAVLVAPARAEHRDRTGWADLIDRLTAAVGLVTTRATGV
jgi:AcrR family transcriptional regulator